MVFDFLKGFFSKDELYKEDVPEVELVVRAISPLAERFWRRKVEAAVSYLMEELQRYSEALGRDEVDVVATGGKAALDEQVATLLATLEERLGCPLEAEASRTVEEAAEALVVDAATKLGVVLSLGTPRERQVARRDLTLALTGKALNDTTRGAVADALTRYLRSRQIREDLRAPAATRSPEATERLMEWRASIKRPLGSAWTSWGPQTVDVWAYRWHNIGRFVGGRTLGVKRWVASNPRDERTTPFCFWVHGKVILAVQIEKRLKDFYSAVDRGDHAEIKRLWPLRDPRTPAGFKPAFEGLRLPPYHFRCRTIIVPAT